MMEAALGNVPDDLWRVVYDYVPEMYILATPDVRRKGMTRVCGLGAAERALLSIEVADQMVQAFAATSQTVSIPEDVAALSSAHFDVNRQWDIRSDCHFVMDFIPFPALHNYIVELFHPRLCVKASKFIALKRTLFRPFCTDLQPTTGSSLPLTPIQILRAYCSTSSITALTCVQEQQIRKEAKQRLQRLVKYPVLFPLLLLWFQDKPINGSNRRNNVLIRLLTCETDDDSNSNNQDPDFNDELRSVLLGFPSATPNSVLFAAQLGCRHIAEKAQYGAVRAKMDTEQRSWRRLARHIRTKERTRRQVQLEIKLAALHVRQKLANALGSDEDSDPDGDDLHGFNQDNDNVDHPTESSDPNDEWSEDDSTMDSD